MLSNFANIKSTITDRAKIKFGVALIHEPPLAQGNLLKLKAVIGARVSGSQCALAILVPCKRQQNKNHSIISYRIPTKAKKGKQKNKFTSNKNTFLFLSGINKFCERI